MRVSHLDHMSNQNVVAQEENPARVEPELRVLGRRVAVVAVLLHGGEGENSRDAFQALSATQQEDILEFLRHL